MNIWLDDEPEKRVKPQGFYHFDDIEEIKKFLELGKVEHLSLDHDLGSCSRCCIAAPGDRHATCPHVPTGMDLVKWMAETGHWSKAKPVVHSRNVVAAKRMRLLIEESFPERS